MKSPLRGLCILLLAGQLGAQEPPHWWKGNTHTHTLWSDGDAAPEVATRWYKTHGYHFLVLSDHNIIANVERWIPIKPEKVVELQDAGQVHLRQGANGQEMRLLTLDELRQRFESDQFLLITGEEVTDKFGAFQVHINGLNLEELIRPQGGTSVADVAERNLQAIRAQGERLGRPTLGHVNHPNYTWSFRPEDLAQIKSERFFEVYNGHTLVHNSGDAHHPGTEEMWDRALLVRLRDLKLPPLYALATDDAHDYYKQGATSNPGRGWVMVDSPKLEPAALIAAMRAGRFYASNGVTLKDFRVSPKDYRVEVQPEPGVTYTIRFTGAEGRVLGETRGESATYEFQGDELYVRATVISSKLHPNPSEPGEVEKAWLQPTLPNTTAPAAPPE